MAPKFGLARVSQIFGAAQVGYNPTCADKPGHDDVGIIHQANRKIGNMTVTK
jgi:hypothetical protein